MMNTQTKYTDREPLVLENRIVTNDTIHIATSCTNYCRLFKEPEQDLKQLVSLHTEIAREARRLGISISYRNKIKSRLDEFIRTRSYKRAYQEYEVAFADLKSLWEQKLEEGLFMGTTDDDMLRQKIVPLQWKIDAMFNRSEPISEVRQMKRTLEQLKREVDEHPQGLFRVYL